ncbi:hypothetical protein G418_07767 [Rhodococcus qingshengii BKS 20-40]|nr:hypothetical protein G418_07767 [Rhodococcus qingshengii BKS 20-40]
MCNGFFEICEYVRAYCGVGILASNCFWMIREDFLDPGRRENSPRTMRMGGDLLFIAQAAWTNPLTDAPE